MSKLKRTLISPVPDIDKCCPCCFRGHVVDSLCTRCGVAIGRGADYKTTWTARGHSGPRRQDQDRVGPNTELARYKEDHQE
jgi:hypothetical protein